MSPDSEAVSLDVSRYPATRGEVVVWGLLASSPYGGMTWQVLHHLAGLRRLGFDVWYVEDSDRMFTDPVTYWPTMDCTANVEYLATWLDRLGLADRWVVRAPGTRDHFGALDESGLRALYARARAVFNLCGSQELKERHEVVRTMVLLDTDPTFKQLGVVRGRERVLTELEWYDHLFTYGTNLYGSSCTIPVERYEWHVTVPPVIVDWWAGSGSPRRVLTTISNWRHSDRDIEWDGVRLRWTKHRQFNRFWDLPRRSPLPLEVALRGAPDEDWKRLEDLGWSLRHAEDLSDPWRYRDYVRSSAGEFAFAKEMVVDTQVGWVSDRTACYLAAGHPAVVQDTAIGPAVPTGEGLRVFRDGDEAVEAILAVADDVDREAKAATELAHECFRAERVLEEIAEIVGL